MQQNILTLLFLALCLGNTAFAQQLAFNINPVIFTGLEPTEFEGVGASLISNTAADARDLRWTLNVIEKAEPWSIAICDKNLCYDPLTTTQTFNLTSGEAGRMDVHAYPNNREGYAIAEIIIQDLADTSLSVSNVYYFNRNPTSSGDLAPQTIKVYPNPSNGLFSVKGNKEIASVQVYSLAGQQVRSFTYGDGQWYDISALPKGTYIVRLVDRDAQQLVTKLMNKM